MKECKECKQIKPLNDFYNLSKKRTHLGDGHVARCKECIKTHTKSPEYRKSQNERQKLRLRLDPDFAFRKKQKDKKYAQTDHGKKTHAAANKKYHQTPKGKVAAKKARKKFNRTDKYRKQVERYKNRFPEKKKTRGILNKAIRDGKIIRPTVCTVCNAQCIPEGHHPNYSKPLDVVWMCRFCHTAVHWS